MAASSTVGQLIAGRTCGHCPKGGGRSLEMMTVFHALVGFRSEKAAQIAAFFVGKAGGRMEKLALIKMIYIAERESVKSRNRPMIYDELYSLKDGPICSRTLDGINGEVDAKIWSEYIVLIGKRDVHLVRHHNDLDQLSNSDIVVLNQVWNAHGTKTSSQLRNWTHELANCPEYSEITDNGRIPISYGEVAAAVGATAHDVEQSVKHYREAETFISRK
jgi:uncharacterized phage-associated protein